MNSGADCDFDMSDFDGERLADAALCADWSGWLSVLKKGRRSSRSLIVGAVNRGRPAVEGRILASGPS